MLMILTNALTKGDEVTIPGFGKFSAVQRAARTGRNPATGAELEIKAITVPTFHRRSRSEGRHQRQQQLSGRGA
jgi:nucleoid DNA-binding protein